MLSSPLSFDADFPPVFGGLLFGVFNHLPRCAVRMDTAFEVFALNYAHTGRIFWAVNDEAPRELRAPVAFWTRPGPRYRYGAYGGESWDHHFVTFSGPRARSLFASGVLAREEPVQPIFDAPRFRTAFERLLERLGVGLEDARAVHCLEELALQLGEQTPPPAQLSPIERAARAWMQEVRAHPGALWSGSVQATRCGVSPAHWRRVVKTLTGLPPDAFVLQARLDAAAGALRAGNEPIKAIATRSGFADVAHFSRSFKRQHGQSPAAYRRATQLVTL